MVRICTAFVFLFILNDTIAQQSIKGKIVSNENNLPVAGASVFISNTSKGTVTNAAGEFVLNDIPAGTHDLVVSFVGFETFAKSFTANDLPMSLTVRLKLKVQELAGVTVVPFEKDGWVKWGKVFMDNFIGNTANAVNCEILNYKKIRFRFQKKEDLLTASCPEPLIIQNRALGYRIQYQLESFEVDYKNSSMAFYGYPLFEEMKGGKKKWKQARQKAYLGSVNHFIRSVYSNKITAEGFDVKRLKKIPNYEKERVKGIYKVIQKNILDKETGKTIVIMDYNDEQFPVDTVNYFQTILRQKDYFDIYSDHLVTADSVTVLDSLGNRYLLFPDYLYITYKNENEEPEYLRHIMESNRKPFYQRSSLILTGSGYVNIEKNGSYFSPQDLFTNGYWGWNEKVANLLPLDYELNE